MQSFFVARDHFFCFKLCRHHVRPISPELWWLNWQGTSNNLIDSLRFMVHMHFTSENRSRLHLLDKVQSEARQLLRVHSLDTGLLQIDVVIIWLLAWDKVIRCGIETPLDGALSHAEVPLQIKLSLASTCLNLRLGLSGLLILSGTHSTFEKVVNRGRISYRFGFGYRPKLAYTLRLEGASRPVWDYLGVYTDVALEIGFKLSLVDMPQRLGLWQYVFENVQSYSFYWYISNWAPLLGLKCYI